MEEYGLGLHTLQKSYTVHVFKAASRLERGMGYMYSCIVTRIG